MRLVVVRHGATANNLEARYTGQLDAPLSLLGERQAEALAERLRDERFDVLVSSDLQRARSTAEAVARYHDLPLQVDATLREIAMGAWEGLSHAEVQERYPEECAAWEADPLNNPPPGGESLMAFGERIESAVKMWYERFPSGNVLWVTHGGLIGVLLCQLLGVGLDRRWQFRRDNTALNVLEIGDDWAIVSLLNDTEHLRGLDGGDKKEQRQVL